MPKFRVLDFDLLYFDPSIEASEELEGQELPSYLPVYEAIYKKVAERILDEVELTPTAVGLVLPKGNFGDSEGPELLVTVEGFEQLQYLRDTSDKDLLVKHLLEYTTPQSGYAPFYSFPDSTDVSTWPEPLLGVILQVSLLDTEVSSTTWQDRLIEDCQELINNTVLEKLYATDC